MAVFGALCYYVLMACYVGWAATLHVPQDQPTIQKAIDAAQAGDTVLIASGTYNEAITLRSGLTLRGMGQSTQISDIIRLENVEGVELSNLQVKGTGQDSHFGIFCLNAEAGIHKVTVRAFHHGINAQSSRLTVHATKVVGSFNVGIVLAQDTEAMLEENEVFDNTTGIIIGSTQRPVVLRRNHVQGNQTGIACHDAVPRLRENVVAANSVGMQIENATPDLGTAADPGKNVFINNKQMAIQYEERTPLDALMNWWGQATGPRAGQIMGRRVRVNPWLRTDPGVPLAVQHPLRYFAIWGMLKQNLF